MSSSWWPLLFSLYKILGNFVNRDSYEFNQACIERFGTWSVRLEIMQELRIE